MSTVLSTAGGLRFEAYLPGDMADWLLAQVEQGHFVDPSEAVFAIVGNFHDLEPHRDLRDELLRRLLQAAVDDPRPGIPHEQVQAEMARRRVEPRTAPARWRRDKPLPPSVSTFATCLNRQRSSNRP